MFPNKDTQLCISISQKPGNLGSFIHNTLYKKYNLNFVYKSVQLEDNENYLLDAIKGIVALKVRGCSVSAPFKQRVVKYLDFTSGYSIPNGVVNTIVNSKGVLTGYNTDHSALDNIFSNLFTKSKFENFIILGAGATAKTICSVLESLKVKKIYVANRTYSRVIELANKFNIIPISWNEINDCSAPFFINTTSADYIPIEFYNKKEFIFDVNRNTNLIKNASSLNISNMDGTEMAIRQALYQFQIYTEQLIYNFDEEVISMKYLLNEQQI